MFRRYRDDQQDPEQRTAEADSRRTHEMIVAHIPAALSVLREAMFDSRSSPAARSRAAQSILKLAAQVAAVKQQKEELAQLEKLDPRAVALQRLNEDELRLLQLYTLNQDEGVDPAPAEIAVARKYAASVQEIRALKMRRLSKR